MSESPEDRDYADSGYPETGPPGSAPDDAGGGDSAVREQSDTGKQGPPDDGKATGNPNN